MLLTFILGYFLSRSRHRCRGREREIQWKILSSGQTWSRTRYQRL